MFGRWRRGAIPPELRAALGRGEEVLAAVPTVEGSTLAASRFGLWRVDTLGVQRWDWAMISKAVLRDGILQVTVADEIGIWPGDIAVLRDRAPYLVRPERASRLTDIVHERVRRSVAAAERVDADGHAGWVVLRRVPGRDGLAAQYRPDGAISEEDPAVVAAVAARLARLRAGAGPSALLDEA